MYNYYNQMFTYAFNNNNSQANKKKKTHNVMGGWVYNPPEKWNKQTKKIRRITLWVGGFATPEKWNKQIKK